MNRTECETLIAEKLHEIVDIYHQYNPDGRYLTLSYSDQTDGLFYSAMNLYWEEVRDEDGNVKIEAGADVEHPFQYWVNERR